MKKFKDCKNGDIIWHVQLVSDFKGLEFIIEPFTINIKRVENSIILSGNNYILQNKNDKSEEIRYFEIGDDIAKVRYPSFDNCLFEVFSPSIEGCLYEYDYFLKHFHLPNKSKLNFQFKLLKLTK